MTITAEEVERRFPIHWLVWNNRPEDLDNALTAEKFTKENLEQKDPRGRTPLLLAVTLGYTDVVTVLIEAGANVNCEKDGWTAVQEATVCGDEELLSLVLSRRDWQRHAARAGGVPELLRRLASAPDFYVEMKWEFTSWVPLVSRMCPSDTYKVYKRGGSVRVDTTLVGFEGSRWERGDRTYIFTGQGNAATLVELDHERRSLWSERLEAAPEPAERWPPPPRRALAQRRAQPVALNYLDTDKISFERNKCGIWGWRQDKTEPVNGYECKVFGASNVELVSKTRTEHLSESERERGRVSPRAPLAGLLSLADKEEGSSEDLPSSIEEKQEEANVPPVSWQEYFSEEPMEHDIGRPKKIATKVQKFRATLWLCEDYPLELQEQIMPILDLMATMSSPHFAKLKDFVQMQLPAGFPVKIEIPLFHVLNARITFGNIFGTEAAAPHVQLIQEGDRLSCVLDDACFAIPSSYSDAASGERLGADDEDLLQYAIQQSLMEAGSHEDQVDVWEALRGAPPSPRLPRAPGAPAPPAPAAAPRSPQLDHEERQLQRAIEASLALSAPPGPPGPPAAPAPPPDPDAELSAALELSARELDRERREREAEEGALREALRLSLVDK